MSEPNTSWQVVEPGVLRLPETQFEIRYGQRYGLWSLYRLGVSLGSSATLAGAKAHAAYLMRDLLEAGIEP